LIVSLSDMIIDMVIASQKKKLNDGDTMFLGVSG